MNQWRCNMKYKPINGWTKQGIVDHITKEFKGKSISLDYTNDDETVLCLYRNPEGKKCVVGMFIPDNQYNPIMERENVVSIINSFPHIMNFLPLHKEAMRDLQSIHDAENDPVILTKMIDYINVNVQD